MHDRMVDKLFSEKSLEALAYLIEQGRELEFFFRKKKYFLSRHGSKSGVSLWKEGEEQNFVSIEDLIEKAVLENTSFQEGWKEVELDILF